MTTEELENKLKISKNTCIHCTTEELAKQVLNVLHQLNLKWCNGTHYITCTIWDSFKETTVYYPFEGEFSSLSYARLIDYKIINAEEFIALHTEGEEFDLENYEPKGDLIGFPKEIIARMLDYQEEQGFPRDVSVFEKRVIAGQHNKGFTWHETNEGNIFWHEVINNKDFNYFFKIYPKQDHDEPKTAKYVQVGNNAILSDITSTQSSVEIEINTTEDNPQEFRVGDEVIDIITGQRGKISEINTNDGILPMYVSLNEGEYFYTLDGRHFTRDKYPRLLHYRNDYNYSVIDFNNLPKRQDKRWRAEKGETYYRFTSNFEVKGFYDDNDCSDNVAYDSGNYFKTKEETQEVEDKLNKYFQELINPNS